jgi:hypothetical protein
MYFITQKKGEKQDFVKVFYFYISMEDFKGPELRGRESFWTFENRISAQDPH